MEEPFVYLLNKLEERRKELTSHMAQGSLADHGEYKKICGIIHGLDFAEEVIKDLAKKMENDDE